MPETKKKPQAPCFIEVENLEEFARLACAFEKISSPIFHFAIENEQVLAAIHDIFRGTQVFYYVKTNKCSEFIAYRNTGEKEFVEMSNSTKEAACTYAPIISFEKSPKIFHKGIKGKIKREKYISIQVNELTSLCKVALYKIVLEEPPVPIFCFQKGDKWIIGTFASLDESDQAAMFFYLQLNRRPEFNFVRYSTVNPEKTMLTNRTDEHGYLYGKIIRLIGIHPLVEL